MGVLLLWYNADSNTEEGGHTMKERDALTDVWWTFILLAVLCVCPLMSGAAGRPHEESCDFLMRGWEMVQFGAAGAVPLALVPIFFFGGGVIGRMPTRAVLLVVGLACYVHNFCLTEDWLASVSDVPIAYEYGAAVFPLVLLTAALWSVRGTLMKR